MCVCKQKLVYHNYGRSRECVTFVVFATQHAPRMSTAKRDNTAPVARTVQDKRNALAGIVPRALAKMMPSMDSAHPVCACRIQCVAESN